ncbi:MAG: ATP-binding protein [Alphaproteobacteria bacterium]|nr:ATP-binding protein [Alphaproteobacteria bacterium]
MAELVLGLNNDLAEIHRLAERVEGFCEEAGLPMKTVFNLNLALDELLTNTMSYGGAKTVLVRIGLAPGRLSVVLEDDGIPFDPFHEAAEPDLDLGIDERPIGGLGVHFVKKMMSTTAYARQGEHNIVTLTMDLPT